MVRAWAGGRQASAMVPTVIIERRESGAPQAAREARQDKALAA